MGYWTGKAQRSEGETGAVAVRLIGFEVLFIFDQYDFGVRDIKAIGSQGGLP